MSTKLGQLCLGGLPEQQQKINKIEKGTKTICSVIKGEVLVLPTK